MNKVKGQGEAIGVFLILLLIVLLAAVYMAGCPSYNVWEQGMSGKAQYAKANANREIKTLEAKAKMESAKYEADAEVIRAVGVAKANKIIGDSLHGNEAYLRYLWINQLSGHNGETIYIPTEAGLPIMEAGKRK